MSVVADIAKRIAVAPLAGAWIEMSVKPDILVSNIVAPLAGAWIEIWNNKAKH